MLRELLVLGVLFYFFINLHRKVLITSPLRPFDKLPKKALKFYFERLFTE